MQAPQHSSMEFTFPCAISALFKDLLRMNLHCEDGVGWGGNGVGDGGGGGGEGPPHFDSLTIDWEK